MSGHSKWSTIKRQKGVADIKRGLTFTKLANAITVVTRQGGSGDPNDNPRLRTAMDAAKAVNMPKENVQRAIDRGLGKLPGQNIEEVTFEGFGPAKVAFLVEGATDNKLRTLQEVKSLFEHSGGNLAGQGAVSYMFERVGEIKVKSPARGEARQSRQKLKVKSKEEEMLELIDLGAEDVEDFEADSPRFAPASTIVAGEAGGMRKYLVYVQGSELNTMSNKLTQAGYEVESQELVYKPTVLVEINNKEDGKKVLEFAGKLEELDDVQKVFTNLDIE